MTTERSGEIKICPYWERTIQFGEHILALCIKSDQKEPSSPVNELYSRLKKCPWYENYIGPTILETRIGDIREGGLEPTIIASASSIPVHNGAESLKGIWDQKVGEFIQRHSQPQ